MRYRGDHHGRRWHGPDWPHSNSPDSVGHSSDWYAPWAEHYLDHRHQHSRFSAALRLWIPIIVSLLIQIPAVFIAWKPGQEHAVLVLPQHDLLLTLAVALVGPLALIWARRIPGPVVVIVTIAASADLLLHRSTDGPPYVALAFALVSAIVRRARVWAWVSVSVAAVVTLVLGLVLGAHWQPIRMVGVMLGVLLVMGLGEGMRTRRERFDELSRRLAARKQTEVQAERVRIARELHDVLAHSLSQINVQSSVALHLMEQQPGKAAEALTSIKEASKTALDEVRAVLGVLRAEDGADPSAPLVPEPDLSRLEGLIASVAAQGMTTELQNLIQAPPPAAIQLALYRIAQESLTNVVRHSGAATVSVTLSAADGWYELTVRDDGSGPVAPRHGTGGRGVLGMRERAELLGGTLEAGAGPGSGFLVVAHIPIAAKGGFE